MSAVARDLLSVHGKWATFDLAGETLAVRVEDVQEVLMPQPLTPVPLAPPHLIGLLGLRGQVVPALDLRVRLGLAPRAAAQGKLVVVRVDDQPLALVVDDVGDVLELPAGRWEPVPDHVSSAHRAWVFGICPVEGDVVLGLSTARLSSPGGVA